MKKIKTQGDFYIDRCPVETILELNTRDRIYNNYSSDKEELLKTLSTQVKKYLLSIKTFIN
ncbi:hypothetical protein GCM10011506_06340 [Marivirga lumbricoides]|uniref:Uncharacterized protein n=1 Tax=Marivirga lumbricoides TaxID=1046115 RepID=A0ABQ1LFC2_9BACT|nr:hypothetical protein GCM10011506_06340 [Marivirga lumbricoides]